MEKIWVSEDWYIPVDEHGYVIGPCFEGMLGCVLQLRRGGDDAEDSDAKKAALKIPRLLADTLEENAYICKMLEEEESAVMQVIDAGGKIADLLAAQFFGRNPLIKRRSTQNSAYPEARGQHDHVVFVSFERDRKPRFCSVNLTEKGFSVFPPASKGAFEKNISPNDWNSLIGATKSNDQPDFLRPVYQWRDLTDKKQNGDLSGALSTQQIPSIWYAAIPSIVFDWAEGNLQEAITKQEIKEWSLADHFTLFEKVLNAVHFLHKQHMIHGDIRPANVMRIGPQEAENYRVGDYGSYGKEWSAIAGQGQHGGLTLVGPAIGRLRETPFYAPERRAGVEFESANIAIIKRIGPKNSEQDPNKRNEPESPTQPYQYLLLLGWRSELLSEDGKVKDSIQKLIQEWPSGGEPSPRSSITDQLQRGDRLRVRNYLFEVIQAGKIANNHTFYICTGRYAEIIHDHLIIYKEFGEIHEEAIIDLSNYVEFHQWSAATDLYGVGALCLYSLFSSGLQKQSISKQAAPNGKNLEQPVSSPVVKNGKSLELSTPNATVGNGKNPDTLFVEMIGILESVPYFKFFWKELERFRKEVETLYDKNPATQKPAQTRVLKGDSLRGQTLYAMALYTTNNSLQSTPKARVVLEQFDRNLAHFLLFMHFVLACLHRQSHMPSNGAEFFKPFATDRTEPPKEKGAANQALQRLKKIKGFLSQPFFRDFVCKEEDQILDFNPRSDFQLRIELENLRREMKREIESLSGVSIWKGWTLPSKLRKLAKRVDGSSEPEQT